MPDLDRQLSEFASFVDDSVEPVHVGEAMGQLTVVSRRNHRWALSVAFAALVAAAILLVVTFAPLGTDDAGFVDESLAIEDPVTPEPGATPIPEPTAGLPDIIWARIADPSLGGEGYQIINSIRPVSSGLMAVGEDRGRPSIWVSDDGLHWTQLGNSAGALDVGVSPYGDESVSWLMDVAENDSRFVAVGIDLLDRAGVSGINNPKIQSVAFWYSDDGIQWTRVAHDEATFDMGPGGVDRIVATDGGFMAIGSAIWMSSDGLTWTRSESVGGSDVMVTDDGYLLVGGARSGGVTRPVAWYSNDGVTWSAAGVESEVAPDYSEGWPGFRAVTAIDDGFLALGYRSDELIWYSPDGRTWMFRGGYNENDGYPWDSPNDIAVIGDHIIVVGERRTQTGQGLTIWESSDGGFTWTVFDDPNEILGYVRSATNQSEGTSIITFEGQFIVGGGFGSNYDQGSGMYDRAGDAAIWIGTTEEGQ